MAADRSFALPPPARAGASAFVEVSFICFLLLVFVGLKPFAIRDISFLSPGRSGSGAGDVWRQVSYLGCFLALVIGAWVRNGERIFLAVSPIFGILLAWCLITSLWAPTPDVAMRRAVLEIVIALSAMLGVQAVGPERAFSILRALLAGVLVVNLISILLVRQAVHLPGESDLQLIGNWRGLYYHKNITGAVCSVTAILFFFRAIETRRGWDWLFFAGAVFFTIMTRSKTSLGLLPVALLAGAAFRITRRNTLEPWIIGTAAGLAATIAMLAVAVDLHAVERFLNDPTHLTGRVAIWQGEIAFIRDHALLGAGFGSFADTGTLSPLYNYVADKWVQGEAHGHNAYLQLCVTIGGVGFTLAMLALIVRPLLAFRWIEGRDEIIFFAPLFAIFLFVILHNFAESDFLEGDDPAWVVFLLLLACLQARFARERPRRAKAVAAQWSAP